ncbi:hypothetical protein [Clostridium botulinum]|uniref:hypothetical protein n=1 Tax=Clostridium botulinum TaxID=1491 RepID=UPI00196779FE|nr:hypothetical protein [Clostridium botulinum]MBN1050313.1 hypothetical protein [Clostridium botulinum]
MYHTSEDYKTYIKKPSREFECKVTIGNNTYNNNKVISMIFDTIQPQDKFSIGNTVSQSLELTLFNEKVTYASVGKVNVEIALKTENGALEYIPMGSYNIDDVDMNDFTVKLTCFDNMIKFETPYFSKYKDTITLKQMINELVNITGVKFLGTIPDYTVKILKGYTCREVLGYIASACGGNAYITRNGEFTINYSKEIDYSITGDNYISYKREETLYKIGKITCQNKSTEDVKYDEDDYDSANDKTNISIGALSSDTMELTFENPLVNENILNDIYNKLKNFSYLGYSLKWQGDLSLDVGDIVTVTDVKGINRKAFIFSNKITYTGGLIQETGAKGESKNKNTFSNEGPSTKNIERLSIKLLIAEKALIDKANIKDLQATNARIENLDVAIAKIDSAFINYAKVEQLNAIKANIADLVAKDAQIANALINKADITQLNVANANISKLDVTVADIKTLVNGNLTSANIHSLVLSADKVTVENGFIKNAMIDSLDVNKINAGTLNTNKINVSSSDGGLIIAGATQQFKDKNNKVRIQIGQDAKGNFDFILRGEDGTTTLIDHTGIKENAITDGLIKTEMVADTAITAKKIDYESFIEGLNADKNTNYIKASKVAIDLNGQSLDIAFNKMNNAIDNISVGTQNYILASAFQNDIYLKYWELNSYNDLEEYEDGKFLCNALVCNNTTDNWLESGQYINTLDTNTAYTISCMANGEAYIYITEICYDEINNRNDIICTEIEASTNEYKKFKATFTTSSNIRYAYLTIATPRKSMSKLTLLKLERGTLDSDWSPAQSDVAEVMGDIKTITESNTTAIKAAQGQISTLISSTTILNDNLTKEINDKYNSTVIDINSIKTSIGEHTSKINEQTGQISNISSRTATIETNLQGLQASFSSTAQELTAVKNNLSNANTEISNNKTQLASLQITLDGFNTNVEEQISNIKIGTRNYIRESEFKSLEYWDLSTYNTLEAYLYNDCLCNALVCNNTTDDWLESGQSINIMESETEYTLSAMIYGKCTISIIEIIYAANNNRNDYIVAEYDVSTNEYKKVKNTFKTNKNVRYGYLTIATPRKSISKIALLKLEKGIIDTDWTVAQEDINNNIAIVENTLIENISTAKSEIKQTTDSINQSVSNLQNKTTTIESTLNNKAEISKITEINSTLSSLNTSLLGITARTETLESKTSNLDSFVKSTVSEISALKGKIALKVEQTDITSAMNKLDGKIQENINTLSGKIDIQAGQIQNVVSKNDVGTIITQSPTAVMTAFNNISKYFEVSPDGAKFGDINSGAYTKMSSNGLEHVDSLGTAPYLYITDIQEFSVEQPNGNTGSVNIFIPFFDNIKTRLNGKTPRCFVIENKFYGQSSADIVNGLCFVDSVTANGFNLYVRINGTKIDFDVEVRDDKYSYTNHKVTVRKSNSYSYGGSCIGKVLILA